MKPAVQMRRGTVFRAVHDEDYEFWVRDEPRSKFCIVFNLTPPSEGDDVHYFITTKDVTRYRETPLLLSECVILAKGTYPFFELETAIQLDSLCVVPYRRLRTKRLKYLGELSPHDIARCEDVIRASRVLLPRDRKLLGL